MFMHALTYTESQIPCHFTDAADGLQFAIQLGILPLELLGSLWSSKE